MLGSSRPRVRGLSLKRSIYMLIACSDLYFSVEAWLLFKVNYSLCFIHNTCHCSLKKLTHHLSVLTTSTEIILGTRKCGPCQERVFIYFELQEAIEAVIQLDLWKKDHSRIITE